jgi:hypothetical protein
MFYTAVDGSTLCRNEGYYSRRPYWTLVHELDGVVLVLILKWCPALRGGDMVLKFLFLRLLNQKSVTPAFNRLITRG